MLEFLVGIFTDGGKAPNIIPDRAELLFYFRAPNKRELQPLLDRAEECFKAGAAATGCTVQIREVKIHFISFSRAVLFFVLIYEQI